MPLRRAVQNLLEAAFFNQSYFYFNSIPVYDDASVVTSEELDLADFIVARVYSRLNVHTQSEMVMKNITSINFSHFYLS